MPHYKDGSEVQVGDVVSGLMFEGSSAVIIGPVTQIIAGTQSCNLFVPFGVQLVKGPTGTVVAPLTTGHSLTASLCSKVASTT